MVKITELAIKRTTLANQRTYLAYMRTGFVIAGIAGIFKKLYIVFFGITMIIGSVIQYLIINYNLHNNKNPNNIYLDIFPVIYVILSLITLYLQFYRN